MEKRALSIQYVKEREFSKFEPLAGSFISALGTGEHIVAQQFKLLASSAQARLRGAVMGAYYDVLTAQERLELAQAASDLAKRAVNVANRRVRAGMVSPVEETRAQVAATGVQVELAQATAELEAARTRLAANWGNPQPRFERVEEPAEAVPPLPELAELYSRLNDSAQLTRARREAERRRAALELERTNRFSNVTVTPEA